MRHPQQSKHPVLRFPPLRPGGVIPTQDEWASLAMARSVTISCPVAQASIISCLAAVPDRQKLGQLVEESVPLDGLADVVVAAQAEAFIAVLADRVGGDGEDGTGETAGAELADGLVAVEHRHLHVHDHGIDEGSIGARAIHHVPGQTDAAPLGEVDRIVDEIDEDLLEPQLIGGDELGRSARELGFKLQVLGFRPGGAIPPRR